MEKIKLVLQKNKHDCIIACLAMITGKSYETVLEECEIKGYTKDIEINGFWSWHVKMYLADNWILSPNFWHGFTIDDLLKNYTCLVIVKSDNKSVRDIGSAHAIVISHNIIYDPATKKKRMINHYRIISVYPVILDYKKII